MNNAVTALLWYRIAGGALSVAQAAALAALPVSLATACPCYNSSGYQFHDVAIANTHCYAPPPRCRLCRGGGGNTVRNITTCQYAGTFLLIL